MPRTEDIQRSHEPQLFGGDRLTVPVSQLMTPGVVSLGEDASLRQTYRALRAHGVHAVLVVDRTGGQPLGWATERGLLSWMGRDHAMASARDAVTEPVHVIRPTATGRQALEELARHDASRLLVSQVAGHFPEGVLAQADLVAFAAD
jgi:CBS domain-containing protein